VVQARTYVAELQQAETNERTAKLRAEKQADQVGRQLQVSTATLTKTSAERAQLHHALQSEEAAIAHHRADVTRLRAEVGTEATFARTEAYANQGLRTEFASYVVEGLTPDFALRTTETQLAIVEANMATSETRANCVSPSIS